MYDETKKAEEVISFSFSKEDLLNAVRYDPHTHTKAEVPYQPEKIKRYIITKDGVVFNDDDLKELTDFIKTLK